MIIDGQTVYLGDGIPQSLNSGEWDLATWPQTSLLKQAKLTVMDGSALVTVTLTGEFVKVDNKSYEFHVNQDGDVTSDLGKLKTALGEACKGFKQFADDFDGLQKTFQNDPDFKGKQNRLERTKALCLYLGESAPIVRQLPTGASTQLPMQIANWIQSTNSEIDKLKANITKQRRNREKNLLEALRDGIDQATLVGTVYRVYGASNTSMNVGGNPTEKVARGIAVKVIEYKKPVKPDDAKDKKP